MRGDAAHTHAQRVAVLSQLSSHSHLYQIIMINMKDENSNNNGENNEKLS